MKPFPVEVITPTRLFFKGDVDALVAPGSEGYFGVLAGHAPLLARLKAGTLKLTRGEKNWSVAVGGGFLEVAAGRATLLVDAAEGETPA